MSDSFVMRLNGREDAYAAALRLESCPMSRDAMESIALNVSQRFRHASRLLPDNEFLGWQVTAGPDGGRRAEFFFSGGVRATKADADWIFRSWAVAEEAELRPLERLDRDGRKVYALRLPSPWEEDGDLCDGRRDEDGGVPRVSAPEAVKSFVRALEETGGTLRFAAGPACRLQGAILLSLPGEMSLRMRTMLAEAFGDARAEELAGAEEPEGLPLRYFTESMAGLLFAVLDADAEASGKNAAEVWEADDLDYDEFACDDMEDKEKDRTEDTKNDETRGTPIEALEFSIRTFNCLKRAGIDTLEELSALTEEELCHIRNLGLKSREEIKHKLSELAREPVATILPELCYSKMLEELIGLEGVKEQVRKITAFARMKQDMSAKGMKQAPVALNMEFVGNPGTAKTTVARIVAGMLHEIGLLPGDELVEVGRADLVARYEGQTADKVKNIFRMAKGKLLFIDEAYSLVETWEGAFGDEAINTIVQEMENNREDTVVVFAGYPDQMEAFFTRNPGLRSRVPFQVRFPDYSAEELAEITELEAQKRGFSLRPEAREKVLSVCETASRRPEMGNGRFCRNLVESAILDYALRVYGSDDASAARDFTLTGSDFSIPAALGAAKKANRIGFAVS